MNRIVEMFSGMSEMKFAPSDKGGFLTELAADLPKRVIHGGNGPYLTRYKLHDFEDGRHVYLHFFHRSDEDRELHNHPWSGKSLILTGGYLEERRLEDDRIGYFTYAPGSVSILAPQTFHRVDLIQPETGCWTLFLTGAKEQSWGFWNRDSGVYTPWREFLAEKGRLSSGGSV